MSTENTADAGVTTPTTPEATASVTESTPPPQAPQSVEQQIQGKVAAKSAQAVVSDKPVYTPNYKFKVHDEEKEFDELFKGLVKDAEAEKKIREFHEKAFGLDVQKPKFEKLKGEHQQITEKYQTIDNSLKQLSEHVRNNDLGAFFEAVNIPKEMVFQFVKTELEKMSAPPEQQAQMMEFERIRRENLMLKQQTQQYMSRAESDSLQSKVMQLDSELARPEVTQISANFDAKRGPGAFKNAVIERGLLAFHTTGQEIPVSQAVKETLDYWSPWLNQQPQTAVQAQAPQAKATLPNVGGRSSSPIKQGIRSMDDLLKAQARVLNN